MSKCKWAGSDQPRELPNGDSCPERHCGTCGHRHVEQLTCPECVGQAREDIGEIVKLDAKMLTEAVHKGVESEAAMLDSAPADPSAWRQRRRYGYRDGAEVRTKDGGIVGENHPLWVLGTWDLLVTEHYGHHRTQRVTVERAAKYLGANLTDLAQDADFAFEDLARDVRQCRAHLEAVLHDQNLGDIANVGCFECGEKLERKVIDRKPATKKSPEVLGGFDDKWTCQGCRLTYTYAEYNFALRASLEDAQVEGSNA